MEPSVPLDPMAEPETRGGFWRAVADSLRGVRQDYTQGSIGRAILLLAVPMVLEMAMESLFGLVDIFFVAHLGPEAAATVALTEGLLVLVYSLAAGLSMSTAAMVARRIGEKDVAGARTAAVQAIGLGLLLSVPVAVCGSFFARDLLRLMGGSPALIETGWTYTTVMLAGSATVFLLFLINAIFRGAGDPAIAMRSLWLANLVNIALVPCLVSGWGPFPEMGITGAAVGTTIGRASGVAYQVFRLTRDGGHIRIGAGDVRLASGVMTRLLRISGPGMLQYLVGTASWMGLVRIVATFGSAALAGYTIALRIIVVALLPSWGLANAAATLVGQKLGAGRPDRAERSVWRAGLYNMTFLGTVGLLLIAFAGPVIRFFADDPEVIRFGTTCLRTVSFGFLFYAWGLVLTQAFNGAGDTTTPTLVNLFCFWLIQIPVAWGLAKVAGIGAPGAYRAIPIAYSALAVVGMLLFRRGRWKERRI